MRKTVKLAGKHLKKRLLETRIDYKNLCIMSIRECLYQYQDELGIAVSNINFWYKHDSVKMAEPYRGMVVDDELVYRFARDTKAIPEKVTYDEFIKLKKVRLVDEIDIIDGVCRKLDWSIPTDESQLEAIEISLIAIYGKETYDLARQEVVSNLVNKKKS